MDIVIPFLLYAVTSKRQTQEPVVLQTLLTITRYVQPGSPIMRRYR